MSGHQRLVYFTQAYLSLFLLEARTPYLYLYDRGLKRRPCCCCIEL